MDPSSSAVIDSNPDAASTGQPEITMAQSGSMVVVSNPEVEALQPDDDKNNHDKDQELIEEELESDPTRETHEGP